MTGINWQSVLKGRWAAWLAAGVGVLLVISLVKYGYVEGDTRTLLENAGALLRCLRERRPLCPEGGKFSPFQLLVAVPMLAAGASTMGTILLLAHLSTACFLGLLLVMYRTLAVRSKAVALAMLLVFGSGELMHYSTHSFVEMATAFFALALVGAWLTGKTAWVGVTAFLAALTKEPAAPLLAALAFLCVLVPQEERGSGSDARSLWRQGPALAAALLAGLLAAAAVTLALDAWRFGGLGNSMYLAEAGLAPQATAIAEIAVSLWLAPNGGWLFFWPLAVATLGCVAWAGRLRTPGSGRLLIASAALYLVLVTGLFARWWSPFGWWAWGQRLMLPWLPALLLVLSFAFAPELSRLWRPLVASPGRAILLAAGLVFLALPHVVSLFRGEVIIHDTFTFHEGCATPAGPGDLPAFDHCIEREAWSDPSPLIAAYKALPHRFVRGRAILYAILLVIATFGLKTAFADTGGPLRRT